MRMKPELNDFELVKLKMKDGFSGSIEYLGKALLSIDGESHETHPGDISTIVPAPELLEALRGLTPYIARSWGLLGLRGVMSAKELTAPQKKAFEVVGKIVSGFETTILSSIEITGISISGSEDSKGVVITGKYKTPSGYVVAINTPKIFYNRSGLGYEEDVKSLCETLREELYEFHYEGKKAQFDIPFDDANQ